VEYFCGSRPNLSSKNIKGAEIYFVAYCYYSLSIMHFLAYIFILDEGGGASHIIEILETLARRSKKIVRNSSSDFSVYTLNTTNLSTFMKIES